MHDFTCTSAEDMHYPVLADRVRYFKEDMKGATTMCREVEKLAMEERQQGRAEGRAEARMETMLSVIRSLMERQSISADDAMQMLQVPEEEKETYRKLLNQ